VDAGELRRMEQFEELLSSGVGGCHSRGKDILYHRAGASYMDFYASNASSFLDAMTQCLAGHPRSQLRLRRVRTQVGLILPG